MNIHGIRHTKVDVPQGICYGQSDVGLASSYPEELALVKRLVDKQSFDAIFSSPLQRCRTLAQDLFPGDEIRYDDRLKELHFGDWELQRWDAISQTAEAKAWFNDFVQVKCPRGEAFVDQIERANAFLDELRQEALEHVVLVTHGGILRALDCLLGGTAPLNAFQKRVDYGELVHFNL
ncbi:alpha-ribazole phosphatase [Sunxiuqinia indica]|uniref:alpha-ribazole phosphatase n=1 Tax=Sunxiuqinia indica TaxID=2692584 RepID=UPI00135C7DE1|nr:alpha-ribazole phosphatase [Sunxiuqinia indica]